MLAKEFSGAVKDRHANPVYDLLSRYQEMYEGEIIAHIKAWYFVADPEKLLAEAKAAGLVKQGSFGRLRLA
ncbi:MAG: hypothetical protein ABI347_00250 [Nitrososphaera sp.]|jgi:hypothetical protein